MVKICLISYYGIRESLLCASNSLKKYEHNVINFSLMENERNENKDTVYDMLIETVKNNNIDVILWWYISLSTDKMKYIIENINTKNIFFSWDDPNGWDDRDMYGKAKYFDCVFTCCKDMVNKYLENGAKSSYHLFPGFDPKINYPINVADKMIDTIYNCDISIVCTNLYENDNYDMKQFINRKELVDIIYQNREKFKFHIYGPPFLKELYPDCYKKEVPYSELNQVFNGSKINICTHTHCQYEQYFNERTFLILGSGGLLYIDKVKGIEKLFENGKDCIYINKYNYIDQICHIINNYNDYSKIKKSGNNKSYQYTWDEWGKFIHFKYLINLESNLTTLVKKGLCAIQ
jgi:Glycosyl transferases group 1